MPGLIQPERQVDWENPSPTGDINVLVKSLFTGMWNSMSLPVSREHWDMWQGGTHIQNAMPYLTADQREFLLSGATPEEWDATFPEDDD